MLKLNEYDYDVALSFAGEDREYVEEVARILHELGVRVFYDRYEQHDLWGKDLGAHLDDVYRNKSKYCVVFISEHYKQKMWTNYERASAVARAIASNEEYILPVRFDQTEIPGIRPTTGYIDINGLSPTQLARLILKKLGRSNEVDSMIAQLLHYLPNYEIEVRGTNLCFTRDKELYAEYPIRLMLEMYRKGLVVEMFILPGLLPN